MHFRDSGERESCEPNCFKGFSELVTLLSNYEYNRLGRIWVIWSDEIRITTVFKSGQMITCSVLLPGCDEEFYCSFVYASNYMEERKELWEDLRHHHVSPLFGSKPWLICGDFNETLEIEEHSNHATNPHISPGMRDFQFGIVL